MIEYKYNKKENKFTENGHTMFEVDVLQRLKRLAYLEDQREKVKKIDLNTSSIYRDVLINKTESMEEFAKSQFKTDYYEGVIVAMRNMRANIKIIYNKYYENPLI